MFSFGAEAQTKYGVIQSPEPTVTGWTARLGLGAEGDRNALQKNATVRLHPNPVAGMFHEDGLGRAATEAEREKRYQVVCDEATKAAQSMRKQYPKVKLALGNGAKDFRE